MAASTPQLSEPIAVRPLKSEVDYLAALAEIEDLLGNVEPDSPDGDKLELLITGRSLRKPAFTDGREFRSDLAD